MNDEKKLYVTTDNSDATILTAAAAAITLKSINCDRHLINNSQNKSLFFFSYFIQALQATEMFIYIFYVAVATLFYAICRPQFVYGQYSILFFLSQRMINENLF